MKNDKDLVHKPNQTIAVKKDITNVQRKAYNVILQKAWFDLKNNKNQRDFLFKISELKEKAGIGTTENKRLKLCLEELADIKVETFDDKDNWGFFHLISRVKKTDDMLLIELSGEITDALYKNNYYTTLDLLTIRSLKGKHSVPLYEMALRYNKVQIPEMPIDELRILTGTDKKKSYDNFSNFEIKVLIPAVNEINAVTDILLSYEPITRGRKTIALKFDIKTKTDKFNEPKQLQGQIDIEYHKINMLAKLFYEETGVEFPVNNLKELVEVNGYDTVREYFSNAKRFNYTKTPVGFFIKAIKESYKIPEQMRNPQKNKAPQKSNYEQRKYEKGYLDSLYDNF